MFWYVLYTFWYVLYAFKYVYMRFDAFTCVLVCFICVFICFYVFLNLILYPDPLICAKYSRWQKSCRIWCESIKYSCQNLHLTLKSRILVFPWPGDFSKAEWSLWAKESAHLVLCLCETNICCFYETKTWWFCIYIIYM